MTHAPMRMLCAVLFVALLSGCRAAPPATVLPAGFDLTGEWQLVPGASDLPRTILEVRARGGMLHIVAQDFPILQAERMSIEQGPDSMGMSYDGADYRDVSWGKRKRGLWEVQAGWQDDHLVIFSEADDANARESFRLSPDGRTLTVEIEIHSSGDHLAVTRIFMRA